MLLRSVLLKTLRDQRRSLGWWVLGMVTLISVTVAFYPSFSEAPEFDDWRWIDYWDPVRLVVSFKRHVYKKALSELAPLIRETTTADLPLSPR